MAHRRIIIECSAQENMRPPYDRDGLGDWFVNDDGDLVIRAVGSDIIADHACFLVALHELIEMKLCHDRGISQAAIDLFDGAFKGDGEPGDDPAAPYRQEHRFACLIEFLMAHEMGLAGYGEVR